MNTNISTTFGGTNQIILPLNLTWEPKPDITTYELATCLPFLLSIRVIMPSMWDTEAVYARHFNMKDPNK